MPNFTLAAIMLAGVTVLSSTVMAGSSRTGPTYVVEIQRSGFQSVWPEQE